ncbi:MAG: hypothetical protein L3K10_08385 [Thermoplasmata archaeon]|nr:hypothetical protein [Thermoplasmata archaeon]
MAALLCAFLTLGLTGAVSFQVTRSGETLAGEQAPTQFLTHWQQVGSLSGVIPNRVPPPWSGVVGFPSRLPRASATERINGVTPGHIALLWVFNETPGIAASLEIEVTFHVHYLVGVVANTATITVYLETQRRGLFLPLTFTAYWDTGQAAGVTFVSQLEVAQACAAIGVCP